MAPVKQSIYSRVEEFKNETMYVFDDKNKIMMCQSCNLRVNWIKKSVVDTHCSSATHISNKAKFATETAKTKQTAVNDSLNNAGKMKAHREDFIKSTVRAFLSANIPLKKLEDKNIRAWMGKYIKGANDLPHEETVRTKIVPEIKKEEEASMKSALAGKNVIIQCDETTDRRGRAIFITLFKILPAESSSPPKIVVAAVDELEEVNAQTCAQTIIKVIHKFDISYKNVKGFVSDSAPYMTACARILQSIIGVSMQHIQCWSHKTEKLEKIPAEKFKRLNEFVLNSKKLFKNTRKRRHNYVKSLKNKYKKEEKPARMFPMPVMTRWTSWKRSADYCAVYGTDIVSYARTLSDQVAAVSYFKSLSDEDVNIILTEACFVKEHCSCITDLIFLLEGNSYPVAHRVYTSLNKIANAFNLVKNASDLSSVLGNQTKAAMNTLSKYKKRNVSDRMREAAKFCVELVKSLMDGDPANKFLKSIATLFDPVKIMTASAEEISEAVENIHLLKDSIPTARFQVLHSVLKEEVKSCKNKDDEKSDVVFNVLVGMLSSEDKEFASLCLQVIYFPVSNVDCERAFSSYGDIVSPKRCHFLTENIETSMFLYFGEELSDVDENDV